MKLKALVSKKVATIALAGTIGLGAVGTATYAAAPGVVDKIVGYYFNQVSGSINNYKDEQIRTIPNRVANAYYTARDSFGAFYAGKVEESKKKIDADINAYIKEKGTLSAEERKLIEDNITQQAENKAKSTTEELKKIVDNEFAK